MKVIDAGHKYALTHLDGSGEEVLTFVKREGPSYPGNVGNYPGTNLQEVFRACIDRVKYLDQQIPCSQNKAIIFHLRNCLRLLEERAARRHDRILDWQLYDCQFEFLPVCQICGHIGCQEKCREE